MATVTNINSNYILNVGTPAGSGTFSIVGNVVISGNVSNNIPASNVSPFITVAANNTGVYTDMGLLAQVSNTAFAGLRFDVTSNSWQTSSSVYANGAPISAYANIGSPRGPNNSVQLNANGVLSGTGNLSFNSSTNLLSITGNGAVSGSISAGGNITAPNFIGNIAITTSANIIYVGTNGNDNNSGGISTPLLTIDAGLALATSLGGNISIHVAPGTYTINNPLTIPPNTALMGDNLRNVTILPTTAAADMFYMTTGTYVWGITIKNYTGNGFSYNPATTSQNVFVSPYIQNLTSSTTTGTAVSIDGNLTSSSSTKAMIVGFFTIINKGGVGIHILNEGYSQLVNIYTIACDKGVFVESGGFCTLNGSDCSIGNYGLVADGVGTLQTSGVTVGTSTAGNFIISSLSNGQPHVNTVMLINNGSPDSQYYTIDTINKIDNATWQVTIQQVYNNVLSANSTVSFYNRSAIIASAHTFEYVGAGTNPATALPQYGGIPNSANNVLATNGGVVTYTSTDEKGNFNVGAGFVINQATGTISGIDFYESLFAEMTPFILALGSD
jgi:hypothetical protein